MCLKNVILILIRQFKKVIKNIIFGQKLKLKYAFPSALYVEHAHIEFF